MDRRMVIFMDRWIERGIYVWIDGQKDEKMYGQMDRKRDKCIDRWKEGWIEGWIDGLKDV